MCQQSVEKLTGLGKVLSVQETGYTTWCISKFVGRVSLKHALVNKFTPRQLQLTTLIISEALLVIFRLTHVDIN